MRTGRTANKDEKGRNEGRNENRNHKDRREIETLTGHAAGAAYSARRHETHYECKIATCDNEARNQNVSRKS